MSGEGKPQLRIIQGGGETTPSSRAAPLVEVERAPTGGQLVLPSMPRSRPALFSVGFEGLTLADFAELLRVSNVRQIVDIRMLAAFRSRTFQRWQIHALFAEFGISYQRIFELGNRFLGTSPNPEVVLQRYARYLREEQTLVRELGARFEAGSFILLGSSSRHEGSEREVVVQALVELGFSFDLVVATPKDAMQVVELSPQKKASTPKSNRSATRPTHPPSPNQKDLPFGTH